MKYWLELALVIGLSGRAVSDWIAGGMVTGLSRDSTAWPDVDPDDTEFYGAKIQPTPLVWNHGFPTRAYYLYAAFLLYWAYVFWGTIFDLIAHPGVVFGALGVPPVVMTAVAYANIGVMVWYAGSYLAAGVQGTLTART